MHSSLAAFLAVFAAITLSFVMIDRAGGDPFPANYPYNYYNCCACDCSVYPNSIAVIDTGVVCDCTNFTGGNGICRLCRDWYVYPWCIYCTDSGAGSCSFCDTIGCNCSPGIDGDYEAAVPYNTNGFCACYGGRCCFKFFNQTALCGSLKSDNCIV